MSDVRWADHETTRRRQEFFDSVAPVLVSSAVGPLPVWAGSRKMSGQFAFRGDDDVLAIVSWPEATSVSADEALAWGLAYGGDRDVVLLLSAGLARPTLQRLPWVTSPVRVFTFDETAPRDVTPAVVPARVEVLDEIRAWGARGKPGAKQLGELQAGWIEELVDWLDERPLLSAAHRQSYLAWHIAGRQVLKIRRIRDGLAIEAGVRYSKPTLDQPQPQPPITLRSALSEQQLRQIEAVVGQAIDRRTAGIDTGHEEHRLQHALLNAFKASNELLGLAQLKREFPAWRPGESPGYIDFLGVSTDGVPHVVETKLDNDVMLALQGLDYWIWATANAELIDDNFDGSIAGNPVIDFVVGAFKTTKAVGPYTLRQLEALDGAISWQFHVVADWAQDLQLQTLPLRRVPGPPIGWKPVGPARYAQRLQSHLVEQHQSELAGARPFYGSPRGGIVAAAQPAWSELESRGLLHRYVNHVRSSQAFALNLFAALDETARIRLATLAGIPDVDAVSEVVFELEDPMDRLGEATIASPHRTQVDVAVTCTATTGVRTLLLIEVKLSELDFNHCSAYEAKGNDRHDVCRSNGPFGGDTNACFQLRNHDREQRRTYDLQLGPTPTTGLGCTFRLGANQPMRNVALGRALVASGEADAIVHALAAPRANKTIWLRWAEAKAALAGIPGTRLADLPADDLVALHNSARAADLAERYELAANPHEQL